MGDFSKPVPTDAFADVLTEIQALFTSVATMFGGTTDTNVPTGAVKLDTTNNRLEIWDGSAWQPTAIGNLAANAVTTASIAADAVDDSKIKLRNGTYLRGRNFANSADLNLLGTDTSDNTFLNAGSGHSVAFSINGLAAWEVSGSLSNAFIPVGDLSADIGTATLRVHNIFVQTLQGIANIWASGNALTIETLTAHDIVFETNATSRAKFSAAGNFYPIVDNAVSLGSRTDFVETGVNLAFENVVAYKFLGPSAAAGVSIGNGLTSLAVVGTSGTTYMASAEALGLSERSGTVPATDAGYGKLFVSFGALKYVSPAGTVTTIVAGP